MNKYHIILSALAMTTAFASCQKEDGSVKPLGKQISIGDVSVCSTAQSRAAETSEFELYPVHDDGNIVEVIETVTDIESACSRSGEITKDNIKSQTLFMNGYIVKPLEGDEHFMQQTTVKHNGTRWVVGDDGFKWRHEMDHHFWAHTGQVQGLTHSDTESGPYTKATFAFTNIGNEDLMMARTTQHYSETDGVPAHSETEIQSLDFYHCLAGINISNINVTFEQQTTKGGSEYQKISGRAYVSNVSIVSYTKGDCEVVNNSFSWDEKKLSDMNPVSVLVGDNETGITPETVDKEMNFIIPQTKEGCKLRITIFDTKELKAKNFDFEFTNKKAWQAGKAYTYSFKATVRLPYAEEEVDKTFDFTKAIGWHAGKLLSNIKYIKSFKISWKGAPRGSEGSFAGVSIEKSSLTPSLDSYSHKNVPPKYMSINNGTTTWYSEYKNLGLSLATKKKQGDEYVEKMGEKGTYTAATTATEAYCEATFDIDQMEEKLGLNEPFDIWIVMYATNAGNAAWHLYDIEITILEYR